MKRTNLKKFIGTFCMIVFVMAIFSPLAFAASPEENTGLIKKSVPIYRVDPVTGAMIEDSVEIEIDPSVTELTTPGYNPDGQPPAAAPSPIGIIGHNDITPVVSPTVGPPRGVVALDMYFDNYPGVEGVYHTVATGFLISPRTVVTAAHCLYDVTWQVTPDRVEVAPARVGNTRPFGSEIATRSQYFISPDYVNRVSDWDDWAVITLNQPLGNTSGYFGLHWQQDFTNLHAICYGYPANVYPDYQPGNIPDPMLWVDHIMYQSIGQIRNGLPPLLKGDWDMTGGFSGGPLVILPEGSTNYCAIGIHSDGNNNNDHYQEYPKAFSRDRAIDRDLYQTLVNLRV